MLFWRHRYVSKSDKKNATDILREAEERFRDELKSSEIAHLALIASAHSCRGSFHATIRGFNGAGSLRFTCHLKNDATHDEAWIYELAREGNRRRGRVVDANVRTAITKYGARVEIWALTRESKKNFCSFELESVPEYVVKLPRSSKHATNCPVPP